MRFIVSGRPLDQLDESHGGMDSLMKKLLVIGGSYFAGRVFVEQLTPLARYDITVYNRGRIPMGMPAVTEIKGDREIGDQVAQRIPPGHWDAVVDFCGYAPAEIHALLNNIPSTIGHYIFISTTSIYDPTAPTPVVETAPKVSAPQPGLGPYADYGYQKWLSEGAVDTICRAKNIPYTILRPAIIYGRYNYAPRESVFFDHATTGQPLVVPEDPNVFYSFVWVDDMAEILVTALENQLLYGKAYNVASAEHFSYATMADVVEEVTGRVIQRRPASMPEIIRKQIPMPFPPDMHLLYDGNQLNRDLSYTHTPLLSGMAHTWTAYQEVLKRKQAQTHRS